MGDDYDDPYYLGYIANLDYMGIRRVLGVACLRPM